MKGEDYLWMQVIDAEIATLEAKLSYVHADLHETALRREYARFRRQRVSEIAPEKVGEVDEIIEHFGQTLEALRAERRSLQAQLEKGGGHG